MSSRLANCQGWDNPWSQRHRAPYEVEFRAWPAWKIQLQLYLEERVFWATMGWPCSSLFSDNSHQLPLWPSNECDKLIQLDTAYLQFQYHNKYLQSNYLLPDSNFIPTESPGNDLSRREPINVRKWQGTEYMWLSFMLSFTALPRPNNT